MKVFKCDEELETVLFKTGFIDVTQDKDKKRGKKEFRLTRNSRNKILFDYFNFTFIEGIFISNEFKKSYVSAEELQVLLWYLKNPLVKREINRHYGQFSLRRVKDLYVSAQTELDFYLSNNIKSKKLKKLTQIVSSFNLNFQINFCS